MGSSMIVRPLVGYHCTCALTNWSVLLHGGGRGRAIGARAMALHQLGHVMAWIIDVAAIHSAREAVVDGNGRDGLCHSWLHAGFERGRKQRRQGRKGMICGVHWLALERG